MSEDEALELYRSKGYECVRGPVGMVFWPSKGVITDGDIKVDYEEKPWLSTFVVKGTRPKVRKNQARDYTNEMKAILQLAARSYTIRHFRPTMEPFWHSHSNKNAPHFCEAVGENRPVH